jgi:hypothetical protein
MHYYILDNVKVLDGMAFMRVKNFSGTYVKKNITLPHLSVCTMSLFIGNIVLLKECYRLLEVLHPNITLTVTEIVSKFQIQSFIRQSTLYTCID